MTTPVAAVRCAGLTDKGRVRDSNEDAWMADLDKGLFIVADGIGGQVAGETASKAVVTVLPGMIETRFSGERKRPRAVRYWLKRDVAALSANLREMGRRTGLVDLGSTLVMAWAHGGSFYVANMGDSRAYLCRNGTLLQITRDHNVLALMLEKKMISPEEAVGHPSHNILTRSLGMEGGIYPDVYPVQLRKGDRLLLCTDGLSEMVPDSRIAQILSGDQPPEVLCGNLIEAANEAGGKDNITAVCVDFE